ncbi:uncharacterized protein [Rutidosis leptorrhynchoides]|uniref:uncharacterized protein n=1 Tax=Rutidosis leptorrhynchoides TaxID=125765 RepID=UPI003A99E7B0
MNNRASNAISDSHVYEVSVTPLSEQSTTEEKDTVTWLKAGVVVSTWIFIIISEPLLERVLKYELQIAYDAWQFLERKKFNDNKLSKTMELNAELHRLEIGDIKLDKITTHLNNLGSTVEDLDLVMYAFNELNDKYPHIVNIILHSQPFLDLDTVRSMLTIEEMTTNRKNRVFDNHATSSNPIVPVAQSTGIQPPSNNNKTSSDLTPMC